METNGWKWRIEAGEGDSDDCFGGGRQGATCDRTVCGNQEEISSHSAERCLIAHSQAQTCTPHVANIPELYFTTFLHFMPEHRPKLKGHFTPRSAFSLT